MAIPGSYNFSYYKGDTLEFNVYPKTSNGEAFDLTSFDNVVFTAARTAGAASEDLINLVATFAPDRSYINCKIPPSTGLSFIAGVPYLYDVQINDGVDIVYTLLTGTIQITEQISPNPIAPVVVLPGNPKNLAVSQSTLNDKILVTVDWETPDAISGAEAITGYKVYLVVSGTDVLINTISSPSTTIYSTTSITTQLGTTDIIPGEYVIKVTTVAGTSETTGSSLTKTIVAPPGPVQNLTISERGVDSATITWTAPASPNNTQTGYILGYNDSPVSGDTFANFTPVLTYAAAPNTTTHTFTGLTALTPYAFGVMPLREDATGFPSIVVDSLES